MMTNRVLARTSFRTGLLPGSPLRVVEAVVLSVLLLVFLVSNAAGQSTAGIITGTVTDASGAAVPGADITVTDENEGVSQHATAAGDGVYHVTDLKPGRYTIRAEAKGFSTLERKGIVLDANRVVNVDVQLAVGSAATKVEVTAAAPVVNTETGTTNYVKTAEEVEDTPLLMRQSHSNLGFAVYNPGANIGSSAEIVVNGARTLDGYSSTDGIVEMADPDGVGGGQISPDLDTIAEVNYITVDAPAEFKSSADFVTVTKSGTNRLHGMGFYEYNSNDLNARNFFSATGVVYHVYNDFVAEMGGPIKKDNTFFFANYDQEFTRGQTIVTDTTALPGWYSGNFSSMSAALKNPFVGGTFSGNQIPTNLITTQGQAVLNTLYPMPNYGPTTSLITGNWRGDNPSRGFTKTLDGRIDHVFGPRDSFFGHYTYRHVHSQSASAYMPPLGTGFQERDSTTNVLSWTHTFSPMLINQLMGGAARNSNLYYPHLVGSDILSGLGIPGVPTSGLHGVPFFVINGAGTTLSNTSQTTNGLSVDTAWHVSDNLSWIHGAHSLKFGFDGIRDYIPGYTYSNIYGTYTFNGKYSGNPVADLLLGLPATVALSHPVPEQTLRGTMWSMYAQDNWKITPRLTATYGLRYELAGPYYDNFGRIISFNPANGDVVIPNNGVSSINPLFPSNFTVETASAAGFPGRTLLQFPKHNFYPRIGLAYKLTSDGKTAIRAAYGIYGDSIYGAIGQTTDQYASGGPFAGSETLTNNANTGASAAKPYVPAFTLADPFTSGATGVNGALSTVSGFNPNLSVPYLQQWNVTLERQVKTIGLSVAYVGAHAVNLLYNRNLSQPAPSMTAFGPTNNYVWPSLSDVIYVTNGATQHYNALELAATKHLGSGLTFTAGFTWQRDLTNQEDNNWAFGQQIQNQYCLSCEYGNNSFTPDRRFIAEAVYQLPFGHGQSLLSNINKYENAAIGGWKFSTVITLQSGEYFTPSFTTYDPSNTGLIGGRPDVVPGVSPIPAGGWTVANYINLAAFEVPGCTPSNPICASPAVTPDPGRFGNVAINTLAGPPMRNIDVALMKNFHTTERFLWQFEVQAVNVLNHPDFAAPSGNISGAGATITATNSNDLQGSAAQRTIYAMIKVTF